MRAKRRAGHSSPQVPEKIGVENAAEVTIGETRAAVRGAW